ncbi:phosphate ABC transporter permease PstA [Bacillus sp. CGMCC 1.16607]|uniref:phosphate ABC transporter permease PstA n=1 Tax=Bacillus sp. CGMCC 1.16607 TaxID=3351842 RepID=UPI0036333A4A
MRETLFLQYYKKNAKAMMKDKIATTLFWGITLIIISLIAYILFTIISKGLGFITLDFLLTLPDEIEAGGGIGPFIFNSLYILILSLLFSLPFGIGAGIFLAEYAPNNKYTEIVRTCVEGLASVPSIVIGLFGYVLFVDFFEIGLTIIGASITLGLLNLPILTRVSEEAIHTVPQELREASFAIGASKAQTIIKVVVPAALNGILTGISLTACRAFGESAVILLAGGTSSSGTMWDFHLLSQGGTLPVHLWYVQSEALVEDAKEIANKSAAVLVIAVFLISFITRIPIWIREKKIK